MKLLPVDYDRRLRKWRGWTLAGQSLGVCEAVNVEEASKIFRACFPIQFEVVTTAYRGAKTTVTLTRAA